MSRYQRNQERILLLAANGILPRGSLSRINPASLRLKWSELRQQLIDAHLIPEPMGMLLDTHLVIGRCGGGGQGEALKVVDEITRTEFVAKLPLNGDRRSIQRLHREARLGAILNPLHHPHLIRTNSVRRTRNGQQYLIVDLVGRVDESTGSILPATLETLRKHTFLGLTRVVRCIVEVALALEVAHSLDIWHRDVKPQNIFIGEEGKAVLGDFGSGTSPLPYVLHDVEVFGATPFGAVIGTPLYIAPELFYYGTAHPGIDQRVDFYSLGATMFSAITGYPPNPPHGINTGLSHYLQNCLVHFQLSQPLFSVLQKLLSPVHERFSDASEVVNALLQCPEAPKALARYVGDLRRNMCRKSESILLTLKERYFAELRERIEVQ